MWDLPAMATRRPRRIERPSGSPPWPFTGKPGWLGINRDTKLQTQFPVYWHNLQNVLVQHFVRPLVSRRSTRHYWVEVVSMNRDWVIIIPYVLDSLFQAYLNSYFVYTVCQLKIDLSFSPDFLQPCTLLRYISIYIKISLYKFTDNTLHANQRKHHAK